MTNTYQAGLENAGTRLDVFLRERLKNVSRTSIQKAVKSGKILLNGETAAPHAFLRAGDVITSDVEDTPTAEITELKPRPDIKLDVVYEDADVAVINKPSGLLVHPSVRHEDDTLANALVARYPEIAGVGESPERPGIMHRLDKDASGLMVVARRPKAYASLKRQFQRHAIIKEYVVLIQGRPPRDEGTITLAIGRASAGDRMAARSAALPGDREAVTHYHVEAYLPKATLLSVRTETGRTHQIRAHFKALGCPVAGDPLYKAKHGPTLSVSRLFLHARKLGFNHPTTRRKMEFSTDLPADLQEILAKLKT